MTLSITELKKEAKNDTELDPKRVGEKSINLASIAVKWNGYFIDEKMNYEGINITYAELKKDRYEYYLHDYKYVVEKRNNEIGTYLEADSKLISIKKQLIISKEKMLFIESVLKIINALSFNIRNYIEWEKFMAGE